MNSINNQEMKQPGEHEASPKMKFFHENFDAIVELEKSLRFVLSETEIKTHPLLVLKLCEGGWLPFREVFKLQKIFQDEKAFFRALSFVKRVEICQNVKSPEIQARNDQNSIESLLIKLNENFGSPLITFYLKKKVNQEGQKNIDPEEMVKDLIFDSIFKEHIKGYDIDNAIEDKGSMQGQSEKENSPKKLVKIQSDISAVICGLKCFLQECASDLVFNVSENFFNIDAKPFTPKPDQFAANNSQLGSSGPGLDLGFAKASSDNEDPQQSLLEKKRQISQMYQYYNYLIFEKNKEHFNDINPDLRKMTYKYDAEVKNAYMTVQASPEVIKAAMGMNVQQHQQKVDSEAKGKKLDFGKEEEGKASPEVGPAANAGQHAQADEKMDAPNLKLDKKTSSQAKAPKTTRFTKDQILQIYRGLGDFKSPLTNTAKYGTKASNDKFL